MKFCTRFAIGTLAGAVLGAGSLGAGAGGLQPRGVEFALTRGIPGDQVNPVVATSGVGGLVLWQDASIDGDGLGISAAKFAADGDSPAGSPVRVNDTVAGDQENPCAVVLPDGRTFVAWQGGRQGFQSIMGRFMGADAKPVGPEIALSAGDGENKIDPTAQVLADGSLVVAWAAYRQDGGSAHDVYGRILDPSGTPRGAEFRINSTGGMGRRSPVLAARSDGGFVVLWVAERQIGFQNFRDSAGRAMNGAGAPRFEVAVVARAFGAQGEPVAAEQLVSEPGTIGSMPAAVSLPGDRFFVTWTRRSQISSALSLDVFSRVVNSFGVPEGEATQVNVHGVGAQFRSRVAATPHGVLVVWSSVGQDGSWEGVFGRWTNQDGIPQGDDLAINTQTGGSQILPTVSSSVHGDLTVVWSSNLPRSGMELFAQRFAPLRLHARSRLGGGLRMEWPTVAGSTYQLQISRDGSSWANVGGPRTANSDTDSVELPASGRVVLYRVVRAR